MKTTIIELLNKIANGEEPPKKILFENKVYELADDNEYYCFEDKGLFEDLFDNWTTNKILDTEVEILETTITYKQDDKIKKLEEKTSEIRFAIQHLGIETVLSTYSSKINEIIEAINER